MAAKKAARKEFQLAAVLDLNHASVLHGELLALRGSDIVIDASTVERVGAQCAQVLVAGAKTWKADNKAFAVEKASDAYLTAMQLIGMNDEFLVPKEI
jgi:chemotaxis protein CheX